MESKPKKRPAATKKAPKPAKPRGYHHLDLRRALLDAAIEFLREGDVTGLTIQVLARAAGVSPGAPYHHFPDKQSILAALATEGYALLAERVSRAVEDEPTVPGKLARIAAAYLSFAREHASHYRIMFLPDIEDRVRFASVHEASDRSLKVLFEVVAAGNPGAPADTVIARAIAALSLCHGFASLRAARVLGNIPGLPKVDVLEKVAVAEVVTVALGPGPGRGRPT
ncbi:TetR/AcrR family transcriptional regulator [Myxococcus sp. K15C18031901]|uniref:TetR/AcrR family transcriptional regulator n=1 Tax=Myxococcus dinghuensis TaxID=2906761 RepID=UPI0020A7B4AF|nr:WHG domain-containing protein [Myxococcus dinghuensis]MCP3098692.1 TetR/AcrR family transcriptional regulator [Myxococcus dinghuensis]